MAIYSSEDLSVAVDALRCGQCVGLPTETVYGLAADALNPVAVARVFEVKRRPSFDPLIVHLAPEHDPRRWVELTQTAERLIDLFWPGPLTLIVSKKSIISDLVTSGHSTVAIRCPAHPIAQQLLRAFDGPLVAPSANPFGRISPTSAADVFSGLGERLPVIIDGGSCTIGLESTIVDTTAPPPQLPILRLGGVAPEALSTLGFTLTYPTPIIGLAPGTLKNHYAPQKPLYLLDEPLPKHPPVEEGYLSWRQTLNVPFIQVLAPSGETLEGATRLFAAMRALDELPCPRIFVEPVPQVGLGLAITDRLKRASSGFAKWSEGEWICGVK